MPVLFIGAAESQVTQGGRYLEYALGYDKIHQRKSGLQSGRRRLNQIQSDRCFLPIAAFYRSLLFAYGSLLNKNYNIMLYLKKSFGV